MITLPIKKILPLLFHRVVVFSTAIAIQAAVLLIVITRFTNLFVQFYASSVLLSLIVTLAVINSTSKAAYKIAWIVLVLLFPIFGSIFYLLFGGSRLSRRMRRKMGIVTGKMAVVLRRVAPPFPEPLQAEPAAAQQSRYIQEHAFSPPYDNGSATYFPLGEAKMAALIDALKNAERYIFLEYFIIDEGTVWTAILDILAEKAQAGVDVRVIYDDVGCLFTLPYRYDRHLESLGIQCAVFNPFIPVLRSRLNNRDHRKIAVIDGLVGFTGGINLADEYTNAKEKYGHWKDTAVMLEGEPVWSLTVMFLALWGYLRNVDEDLESFRPTADQLPAYNDAEARGVIQPFTDNPLDDEPVGETVYLNMISKAEKYIYITTPYLILDSEIMTALGNAAKSGIDVRIITPHIPDKWYVHAVTRSYYHILLLAGVRIYEYTPGFMHSKTFVVDDKYSVIGTINLDYRSLYLHFECGTWLYGVPALMDVKRDFLQTLPKCEEIYIAQLLLLPWYRKVGRTVLRIFAPLM